MSCPGARQKEQGDHVRIVSPWKQGMKEKGQEWEARQKARKNRAGVWKLQFCFLCPCALASGTAP